jgi:hypothetical protein
VCDKNGWKRAEKPYFYFCFYFFLAEMESILENVGSEKEPEYAGIRKRTVGNSTDMVRSQDKPKYRTSLYSQITIITPKK